MMILIRLPGKLDLITRPYLATNQDFRKDPLTGHDTVTDCVEDVSTVMTDLADLRDFQKDLTSHFQPCADRESGQIDALCGQIFGEITILDVEALRSDLVYAFLGKETDLPDPRTYMGIIFQTMVHQQQSATDIMFFFTFRLRNIYG